MIDVIKTWEDRKYPLFYCLNNNKIAIRYNVRLPNRPYERVLGAKGIVI